LRHFSLCSDNGFPQYVQGHLLSANWAAIIAAALLANALLGINAPNHEILPLIASYVGEQAFIKLRNFPSRIKLASHVKLLCDQMGLLHLHSPVSGGALLRCC
jgi:hypothetical protein